MEPIKIFYCYAPQDRNLRDRLDKHLMSLKRLGQVTLRLNREIMAGANWNQVEDRRFHTADLILLLISPDFIASNYHYGIEMHNALEKHEAGNVWVTPIILRPTPLWEKTPLGKLQALPKNRKAITEQRNRDSAFVDIVEEISKVVAILFTRRQEATLGTRADGENSPQFTRVIGPPCITCGARNTLGVANCENCGDLLFTNILETSQKVPFLGIREDKIAETSFLLNLVNMFKCPNCGVNRLPSEDSCRTCGFFLKNAANTVITLQGGRYIVEGILGQGGMGVAILARDRRLDSKPVVIKALKAGNTDPDELRKEELNFKREVVTLAHCDHPLIPNVTDNFEERSHFFMVQEYIKGENLENRLDRLGRPMEEREALIHASEILDVLDYLAQQTPPVVHRDIKPANIIIGEKDKKAHLVDFGIARPDIMRESSSLNKESENQSKQTSALGTPGYAPPEQYQGNADPRSDLYALGATLYHLLTNHDPRDYPPFHFPSALSINPQLSPEVDRLLVRSLQNDFTQRYQSAALMMYDVDEILSSHYGISSDELHPYGGSFTALNSSMSPSLPLQQPRKQRLLGPQPFWRKKRQK